MGDNQALYTAVVSNALGSVTSNPAVLTVTPLAIPPTITSQPQSASVQVGHSVSFAVTAIGTAPLNYQWRKGGNLIGEAIAATYTIASAKVTDAGSYDVVVNNTTNMPVTSSSATLTVTEAAVPPSISVQPVSLTVTEGNAASFSVTASGSAPLAYQWQQNLTDIPGAFGTTYTLPSALLSNNGKQFRCKVSNSAGEVYSSAATLTVNTATQPPVITAFSANPATISLGQSSTLSWAVTGASQLSITPGVGDVTGLSSKVVTPTSPGSHSFLLVASNASGVSQASTPLVVNQISNQAPSAPSIIPSGQPITGHPLTFSLNAVDPEADQVTFLVSGAISYTSPATGGSATFDTGIGLANSPQGIPPISAPGTMTITVVARDAKGASSPPTSYTWTESSNRPPPITSPSTAQASGTTALFNWTTFFVAAQDPDGDDVKYAITGTPVFVDNTGTPAPGLSISINPATGALAYSGTVPTGKTSVTAVFTVVVEDYLPGTTKKLGAATSQVITLTYAFQANQAPSAPVIVGPTTAITLHPAFYNLSATDPEGDAITFLVNGTAIAGSVFTLNASAAGATVLTVVARDSKSANSAVSTLVVNVSANRPPQFTSQATGQLTGSSNTINFGFTVVSQDPDGDDVKYSITGTPTFVDNLGAPVTGSAVVINPSTGVVIFSGAVPLGKTSVSAVFTVQSADYLPGTPTPIGSTATQIISLTYFNGNLAPSIVTTSLPNLPLHHYIPINADGSGFAIIASDPNGDAISWTINPGSFPGLALDSVTGNSVKIITTASFVPLVSTTTPITFGVTATDARGLFASKIFTITPVVDSMPMFTSSPVVNYGPATPPPASWSYQAQVSDAEGDLVEFSIKANSVFQDGILMPSAISAIDPSTGIFTISSSLPPGKTNKVVQVTILAVEKVFNPSTSSYVLVPSHFQEHTVTITVR